MLYFYINIIVLFAVGPKANVYLRGKLPVHLELLDLNILTCPSIPDLKITFSMKILPQCPACQLGASII